MDTLGQKYFDVEGDIKYAYYTSPAKNDLPTLLLIHGCPDTASLWSDLIISHLLPAGYGVIAPDLIGYGDTDKPNALEHYNQATICKNLLSILDKEHLDTIVALGHDFGAFLASKLCTYHPERVSGLITLGTAFLPPSPYPFNFEQVKQMQEQYQGYCSSWYFPLFISENGAQVIEAHLEQMFTLLHGGGKVMKETLCVESGIEKWLNDSSKANADVLPYANTVQFREEWIDRLRRDGWTGPLNWYKAVAGDLSLEADKAALEAGRHVLKARYLFIGAIQDPLAPVVAVHGLQAQGLLEDATVKEVDAGHWCMLEKPKEVGGLVVTWLDGRE